MKCDLKTFTEKIVKSQNMGYVHLLEEALNNADIITKDVLPLVSVNKGNLKQNPSAKMAPITIDLNKAIPRKNIEAKKPVDLASGTLSEQGSISKAGIIGGSPAVNGIKIDENSSNAGDRWSDGFIVKTAFELVKNQAAKNVGNA